MAASLTPENLGVLAHRERGEDGSDKSGKDLKLPPELASLTSAQLNELASLKPEDLKTLANRPEARDTPKKEPAPPKAQSAAHTPSPAPAKEPGLNLDAVTLPPEMASLPPAVLDDLARKAGVPGPANSEPQRAQPSGTTPTATDGSGATQHARPQEPISQPPEITSEPPAVTTEPKPASNPLWATTQPGAGRTSGPVGNQIVTEPVRTSFDSSIETITGMPISSFGASTDRYLLVAGRVGNVCPRL